MIGRFPYQKLASYPHMKPEDVGIWERFLAKYPDYFQRCDYDVKVGQGRMPEFRQTENMEKGWRDLTQKKIDVVGYNGENVCIVEVKPNARANALGQMWMYDELYKADFNPKGRVHNLIITDREDTDTMNVAKSGDIEIIIV